MNGKITLRNMQIVCERSFRKEKELKEEKQHEDKTEKFSTEPVMVWIHIIPTFLCTQELHASAHVTIIVAINTVFHSHVASESSS